MSNDTNTDNDTIRSSDDTIRSAECEHKLTSQLAKILAVLPDRLISRGVEGVIAALHEVRHIERHCRSHPAAASVQAVELLNNEHRLDTIVQRYLSELTRAAVKAEEAKANAEKHRTLANEAWAQRDTAERDLDAARSMCAKLASSNLRGTLLESLGLDEATIEAAAKLAAGTPVPSSHVDPTPNSLVVRLAEVLTGCPMSTTELVETRVTRAAASILRWIDDPKVPAVKLSPSLPVIPEDLRTDLIEATGLGPDATFKDIIQAAQSAFRQRSDLSIVLGFDDILDWSTIMARVESILPGRWVPDLQPSPSQAKPTERAAEVTATSQMRRLAGALGLNPDAEFDRVLARAHGLAAAEHRCEDHAQRAIEACRVDLAAALGFENGHPWETILQMVKRSASAHTELCLTINKEHLLPDEPASDSIVQPVLRTLRRITEYKAAAARWQQLYNEAVDGRKSDLKELAAALGAENGGWHMLVARATKLADDERSQQQYVVSVNELAPVVGLERGSSVAEIKEQARLWKEEIERLRAQVSTEYTLRASRCSELAIALDCDTTTPWGVVMTKVRELVRTADMSQPAARMALANARRDLAAELGAGDDEGWDALLARVKVLVKDLSPPRRVVEIKEVVLAADDRSRHDREQFRLKLARAMDLPDSTSEVELLQKYPFSRNAAKAWEAEWRRVSDCFHAAEARLAQILGENGSMSALLEKVAKLKADAKKPGTAVKPAKDGEDGWIEFNLWLREPPSHQGEYETLVGRPGLLMRVVSDYTDDGAFVEIDALGVRFIAKLMSFARMGVEARALSEDDVHAKLVAIIDPKDERKLSLEGALEVVRVLAQAKLGPGGCFDDYAIARILHESGRPAVKDGQSVSGATTSVEWHDLPPVVRAGRLLAARHLMGAAFVDDMPAPAGATVLCKEAVARAIHLAERDTIDRGWVLNPTGKPWIEFDQLGEAARAGRLRQAEAMECAKVALWVWDK